MPVLPYSPCPTPPLHPPCPSLPAVSTQKSPTMKQRMQEAAEMLEAGRSPLRDSMILRQSEQ